MLLDVNDRKYVVKGLGQSNIWYGNEEEDRKVETIIENYEKDKINKVTEIEKYTEELEGKEKEAVVKVRINQDKFREKLINKIYSIYDNIGISVPKLEKDNEITDIDPFTVFGLFNKGITNNNRILILNGIASEFQISANVPDNFDGVPVLNNLKATYNFC